MGLWGTQARSKIAIQLEHPSPWCDKASVSGEKHLWPALFLFFVSFDFEWPSSRAVCGKTVPTLSIATHLCASLCLALSVSFYLLIHLCCFQRLQTLFKLDAGQPIAGLGWMNWCYQCLGRWELHRWFLKTKKKEKKRGAERSLCET